MAAVRVDSGKISAETDRAQSLPKERWPDLVDAYNWWCEFKITYDCRCVTKFLEDAELMWEELGYESADDLIQRGYGLEPEEIRIVSEWLRLNDPESAVPMEDAVKAAVVEARENHQPTHADAGAKGGRGKKATDNISSFEHGTSQTYTLRRLARDRPDLLDKVETGELTPNSAAIEAGFRKKKIQIEPTPEGFRKAINRYMPGWQLVNTETGEVA